MTTIGVPSLWGGSGWGGSILKEYIGTLVSFTSQSAFKLTHEHSIETIQYGDKACWYTGERTCKRVKLRLHVPSTSPFLVTFDLFDGHLDRQNGCATHFACQRFCHDNVTLMVPLTDILKVMLRVQRPWACTKQTFTIQLQNPGHNVTRI